MAAILVSIASNPINRSSLQMRKRQKYIFFTASTNISQVLQLLIFNSFYYLAREPEFGPFCSHVPVWNWHEKLKAKWANADCRAQWLIVSLTWRRSRKRWGMANHPLFSHCRQMSTQASLQTQDTADRGR